MDIQTLKDKLLQSPDKVEELLTFYDFDNFRLTTSEIRCSHNSDSNASSVRVKLCEGLPSTDFSKGVNGDIFTVICTLRNKKLFEVLLVCKQMLGIDENFTFKKQHIFGGIYHNIRKTKKEYEDPITYPDCLLDNYNKLSCERFCKDGIKPNTQKIFEVGYDYETHRITVPWRTSDGRLLGIMGRYNGQIEETHAKWFPVISFSKRHALYGFYQNYLAIVQSDIIYIGESEKFVMQLHTMGVFNCVALGGNTIGDRQIKELLMTNPSKIIFCYDEGLDIKQIINECLKVKNLGSKFGVEVGYIYDSKNEVLKKDSKDSPSDLGLENWNKLTQNYIIYV